MLWETSPKHLTRVLENQEHVAEDFFDREGQGGGDEGTYSPSSTLRVFQLRALQAIKQPGFQLTCGRNSHRLGAAWHLHRFRRLEDWATTVHSVHPDGAVR